MSFQLCKSVSGEHPVEFLYDDAVDVIGLAGSEQAQVQVEMQMVLDQRREPDLSKSRIT